MMMRYYVEFGGGLGDIFYQIYTNGRYNALETLGHDETAVVGLVTHNPFAAELFRFHPQRARLDVRDFGYWLPEGDDANRRRHGLPPYARPGFDAGPTRRDGPVTFYASDEDLAFIAGPFEQARRAGSPLIVFSVSAGETYKSLPEGLVAPLVDAVCAAGCLPVFVGRSYERNDRREMKGGWLERGIDAIDRLTVPGTAVVVQRAAGVVCCHSSVSMLASMERKPQLLLYPRSLYEAFIRPRTLWAAGVDNPETVHGLFEDYGAFMMEQFLHRVESASGWPSGTLARDRPDVREFLKTLPNTTNPLTGEDYKRADWFTAENGYPFYARAAEAIRPDSILEIGSFLGFGLAAFIRGYPNVKRVVSLDNESYVPGSRALCSENLAFYDGEKLFARSVDDVAGRFDLVHVDADHSFTGALCDIAFAWALRPRVMLVDDFLFLEDVRRAAEAFAGHYGARLRVWNSYRGWAVFAAPDTMSSLPLNL